MEISRHVAYHIKDKKTSETQNYSIMGLEDLKNIGVEIKIDSSLSPEQIKGYSLSFKRKSDKLVELRGIRHMIDNFLGEHIVSKKEDFIYMVNNRNVNALKIEVDNSDLNGESATRVILKAMDRKNAEEETIAYLSASSTPAPLND